MDTHHVYSVLLGKKGGEITQSSLPGMSVLTSKQDRDEDLVLLNLIEKNEAYFFQFVFVAFGVWLGFVYVFIFVWFCQGCLSNG